MNASSSIPTMKKLLIKSGNVKLRSSPLKPPRELLLELYPQRLQYFDFENEDAWETVLLKNCWTATSSSLQGYAAFELSASNRIFHFVVANYCEVESWISAINCAKTMSDYRDDDDDDPSSLGPSYAMQPVGQHSWFVKAFTKPTYCNVCRQSLATFQRSSLCCQICKLKIHKRCADRCQLDCKWTTSQSCGDNVVTENNEVKMCHQWVEGNLPFGIRCCACSKKCGSLLRLQDFRCLWCRVAVHSSCLAAKSLPNKFCTFDQSRLSVLPPSAVRSCESIAGGFQAVKPISSSPLMVFINLKSGSQEGAHFMRRFRQLLNPIQVSSLTLESAAPALQMCATLDSFRVLVCGGDGSVAWVLSEIDKLGLVNKCHVGILPLGTGNDMSRVLGWGSTVSLKLDVCEIIKNLEQALVKMLDRWSILTYAFPASSGRNANEASTPRISRPDEAHRSRRSPHAFILRLENQISSQLEDLSRLCASFVISPSTPSTTVPANLTGPSTATVTCTASDASSSTAAFSSSRSSNSDQFDEIRKRIGILPDLVHSYATSIKSIGTSQRCSQSLAAEVTTGCDAAESRVRDLVRCWTLIQSRSTGSGESATVETLPVLAGPQKCPAAAVPSNAMQHPNYQQFLRPPPISPTPDFDSGCSSDFDVAEEIPVREDPLALVKYVASTSSLVRSMSTATSVTSPVTLLTAIIRQLQIMIPQLSQLLIAPSEVHPSSSGTFRARCVSVGRSLADDYIKTSDSSALPLSVANNLKPEEPQSRNTLSVGGPLSFMKAQSCGAIAHLSTNDSPNNFGDSGCSVGADDSAMAVRATSPTSPTSPTSESKPVGKLLDSQVECSHNRPAFEKKRRLNHKGGISGIFSWSNRPAVTPASSYSHLAVGNSLNSPAKEQSNSKYRERSRSPGAITDGGFIRQMLYSSARTLSSVCRQLMIPDPSLVHLTPASAPFEERCVMNNYFGIGLDARIALDFHTRREEAPESFRSRARNFAWFGMLGTKQFVQQTYRNLEQRVQLECDGERLLLPSLQGILVLNIPSYMGGVNFWGSTRASHGFAAPSFDDHQLEVVAIFGSAQMAASRVIRLHHHRIAQCRTVRITILDSPLPVQVDGEAWLHPPGVIVIRHKNRAQMLARDLDFVEVLRAWHRASTHAEDEDDQNHNQLSKQSPHNSRSGYYRRHRERPGSPPGDLGAERGHRTLPHRVATSPNPSLPSTVKHRRAKKGHDAPLASLLSRSSSDINCVHSREDSSGDDQ